MSLGSVANFDFLLWNENEKKKSALIIAVTKVEMSSNLIDLFDYASQLLIISFVFKFLIMNKYRRGTQIQET